MKNFASGRSRLWIGLIALTLCIVSITAFAEQRGRIDAVSVEEQMVTINGAVFSVSSRSEIEDAVDPDRLVSLRQLRRGMRVSFEVDQSIASEYPVIVRLVIREQS